MKKNVMMRLAAVMLMCVLLSTSVIGGTFAKYTTQGTSTDTARVAKWGVVITPKSDSLFETFYDDASNPTVKLIDSYGVKDLVAPGTTGTLTPVDITGKPEVAVNVKYEATVTLTGWEYVADPVNNPGVTTEYCPIIFTVEGVTYGMQGTGATNSTYASVSALATAVENAINDCTADYDVNTDMSTVEVPNVIWNWPFENSATNTYSDDAKDTALGNLDTLPTIILEIITTVTQID